MSSDTSPSAGDICRFAPLYVLDALSLEGLRMRPGDYCRAEPGSVHSAVRTAAGALFLALSSQQDELLA